MHTMREDLAGRSYPSPLDYTARMAQEDAGERRRGAYRRTIDPDRIKDPAKQERVKAEQARRAERLAAEQARLDRIEALRQQRLETEQRMLARDLETR